MNSIPSVLNVGVGNHRTGGLGINNGQSTSNSPNIHGLGTQATLSLMNGHRMWGSGNLSDVFDPNLLPSHMVSQVEVVQDGTSPIYGADAISGTVNYILRKPANVFETYFSETGSTGHNYHEANVVFGRTWGEGGAHSGGFIVGYKTSKDGALYASSFPNLYNNDFSPYGGAPSSTFSNPGNVLIGSTTYAVPYAQNGQTLTLSQLGAPGSANRQNLYADSGPNRGTMISNPDSGSNAVLNYYQNLSDGIQLYGDFLFANHHSTGTASGSVNQIAAKVPNSNPYSPCNPSHYANGVVTGPAALLAACATGTLTVNYNTLGDIGGAYSEFTDAGWDTTTGLHIKLPGDWQVTPSASINQHRQWSRTYSFTTPNVNTYNYFCDVSAFNCSTPSGIGIIVPPYQGVATAGPILSTGRFYQAQADGALFSLPGGKVRLAAGLEYNYWEAEKHTSTNTDPDKHERAAYAELYVPIVGAGNAITGIQSLELDVAGRIDAYSDTGTTRNPKIGINWTPFNGMKVHGSYGTSFRGAFIQNLGSLAPRWTTSTIAASGVNPALCPQCTNPALFGTFGSNKLIYSEAMGNHNDLLPETSKSYSLGFDWSPQSLPGLTVGVNAWWINYINQVGNPESSAGALGAVNSQLYNDHIIYNPAFFPKLAANNPLAYYEMFPLANLADPNCAAVYQKRVTTQALYNSLVACANNPSGGQAITGTTSANPNDVPYFTYFGQVNAGITNAQGFDLNGSYSWRTRVGNWTTNLSGEVIPKFDVQVVPGAPIQDEAGGLGYVLKVRGRLQLTWQRDFSFGSLSSSLFVNYNGPEKMDLALLPAGVPASYARIASFTTEDVSIVYNTGTAFDSWISKNISFILSSQNITAQKPPLAINSTILFDPNVGWPPTRVIQFQVGKSW